MLESYKIARSNNEEVLYLYLNVDYEFGEDLEEDDLEKKARNYLVTHDIKFNGNKIVFIVNGISTKMITIENNKTYLNDYLITLNTKEKITIKALLLSLLFSNINISLREETLKSLTVLYRGEIIYNLNNNYLDINKLSLSYHNYNYYKVTYPETYKSKFEIFNKVIDETNGEYLINNRKPIRCFMVQWLLKTTIVVPLLAGTMPHRPFCLAKTEGNYRISYSITIAESTAFVSSKCCELWFPPCRQKQGGSWPDGEHRWKPFHIHSTILFREEM